MSPYTIKDSDCVISSRTLDCQLPQSAVQKP